MTTIRNNAASPLLPSASQALAATDGASQAQSGPSPFAALLQQHVDAEATAPRASAPLPQNQTQSGSQNEMRNETRNEAQKAASKDDTREPEQSVNKQAEGTPANKAEGKTDGKVASKSGSKAPNQSGKTDKTDKAGKTADQDDQADAQADAADGKSATANTDPLATWLAALHGGATSAHAVTSGDAAGLAGEVARHALTGLRGAAGEGQAVEGQARATLLGSDLKTDAKTDQGGFAALLAASGRASDAASGNALGLAAVRMLNAGGDQSALQMSAQQGDLRGAAAIEGLDASAQAAALASLNGVGAAHGQSHDAPTVAAPVGSTGFAGELADQVQVMVSKAALDAAAGSVHEARLNLNPAEMGPISIRIALEGNQAQVDFAAASGVTRQAIEDSMPALASALNSAGLTLSGGGVSQEFAQARQDQARQSGASGTRSPSARDTSGGEEAGGVQSVTTSAANWVRRPEGRLDLYA